MRRYIPFLIIGAVLLSAAGGGVFLFRSMQPNLKIALGKPGAEPPHVRGGSSARVTLEEFGDFQCPPCGLLATTLLKLEHDYGNKIRVVFREFPLAMHKHALTAARAAEAAGMQGRFWEMHDMLFETAQNWGMVIPRIPGQATPPPLFAAQEKTEAEVRTIFADYAVKLGLDVERFKADMESEAVMARIKSDQERGASIGVDRTPILFIDGVHIPYASFKEELLRAFIDDALNGKPPVVSTPAATPSPTP